MLSNLIARLEAAETGSREIDREIMTVFYQYGERHIGTTCWDDEQDTCCPGAKHLDRVWIDRDTDKWRTNAIDGLEFTSSLDEIVALVERKLPGRVWMVMSPDGLIQSRTKARAEISEDEFTFDTIVGEGATPALALCTAFLRAWAGTQTSQEAA